VIVEGLKDLEVLKSIVIKHNEINHKTTEALQTILDRDFPANVEELRLISCKMGMLTSGNICRMITKNCNLLKLSLVQA